MELDTLNVVAKPTFSSIKNVVRANDDIKSFVIDADDEHYDNRKIMRHVISCSSKSFNAHFICSLHNISSILTCVKEINGKLIECEIGVDVSTYISKDLRDPIFLASIYQYEDGYTTLNINRSKVFDTKIEILNLIFNNFIYKTIEKDAIVCIGNEFATSFISDIKESCRYFVGITNIMPNVEDFIHQGVRIVKRL